MDVILHLKVDGKHTDLKFEKDGRIFDDVFELEQHEKIHVFNALFRYVELFDSVLSLTYEV